MPAQQASPEADLLLCQQPESSSGPDVNEYRSLHDIRFLDDGIEPETLEGNADQVGNMSKSNDSMPADHEYLEGDRFYVNDNTGDTEFCFHPQSDGVGAEHDMGQTPQAGRNWDTQGHARLQQESTPSYQQPPYYQSREEYLSAPDPVSSYGDSQPSFVHSGLYGFGTVDHNSKDPGIFDDDMMAFSAQIVLNTPNHGTGKVSWGHSMEGQAITAHEPLSAQDETQSDLSGSGDHSRQGNPYAPPLFDTQVVFKPMGNTPWSTVNMRNPFKKRSDAYGDDFMRPMGNPHGSGTSAAPDDTRSTAISSISLTTASLFEEMDRSVATLRDQHKGDQTGDGNTTWAQQLPIRSCGPALPAFVVGHREPELAEQQIPYNRSDDPSFRCDDNYLAVPDNQGTLTGTSSTTPEVLFCRFCKTTFTGKHRRGNWQRHNRLKHGDQDVSYPCQGADCKHKFKRTDARLKHYRKYHPHLASDPPKPREYARNRRCKSKKIRQPHEKQHGKVHQQKELKISPVSTRTEDAWATARSDGTQSRKFGYKEDLFGFIAV